MTEKQDSANKFIRSIMPEAKRRGLRVAVIVFDGTERFSVGGDEQACKLVGTWIDAKKSQRIIRP